MRINYLGRLTIALGLIGPGLMVVAGCNKSQGSAAPPAMIPEAAFVTLAYEPVVITTELPARTSAYLVADVRPQVGGIIQERLFTEGAEVKQGDILYKIDPALYQAAYDNAVAGLARAEAMLPPLRLKEARYKDAVASKAISQQAYDEAFAALKQAEADIQYSKAAVQSAKINLGYTQLTAPISGRIGKSNFTVGALVSAQQPTPLAVIQQFDPIYVDAPQSSANLVRMKRYMASGQLKTSGSQQARAKLLFEDRTPYSREGMLKFSDVTVDPSTGSFILRMVFPNPDYGLLPGMYVRAIIEEGTAEQAILAPQQGISRDLKGNPIALVIGADSRVELRPVTADRSIGDKWLVSSGLAPGDRLIVEGVLPGGQRLRPGMPVKAVPFDASAATRPAAQRPIASGPAAKGAE